MLKQWLNHPLTDQKRLNVRLDVVESFHENNRVLEDFRDHLKQTSDIERIVGRVNNGKVSPKEINGLRLSLEQIPEVKSVLKGSGKKVLKALVKRFGDTDAIVDIITKTVHLEAPAQIKQGNVILGGGDNELDALNNAN